MPGICFGTDRMCSTHQEAKEDPTEAGRSGEPEIGFVAQQENANMVGAQTCQEAQVDVCFHNPQVPKGGKDRMPTVGPWKLIQNAEVTVRAN